jgi:hypothetical protein
MVVGAHFKEGTQDVDLYSVTDEIDKYNMIVAANPGKRLETTTLGINFIEVATRDISTRPFTGGPGTAAQSAAAGGGAAASFEKRCHVCATLNPANTTKCSACTAAFTRGPTTAAAAAAPASSSSTPVAGLAPIKIEGTISQFNLENGKSACTVISLESAATLLPMLESHSPITPTIINDLVNSGTAEYTRIGLNEGSLMTIVWEEYNKKHLLTDVIGIDDPESFSIAFLTSNPTAFNDMIDDAYQRIADKTKYSALIIIKSPETVAVFIPPEKSSQPFFLFNSHSKPEMGYNNAYLIGGSAEFIIAHLKQIFPMIELNEGNSPLPEVFLIGEAFLFQSKSAALGGGGASSPAAHATKPAGQAGGSRRHSAKRKKSRKTHKSRKSRPRKSRR